MKKLLILTFASVAVAGCNGSPSEQNVTNSPITAPAIAATAASFDTALADKKATEVLATVGSIIQGGDPNGRYELGEALPLHYVQAAALHQCDKNCAPEMLLPETVDRIYPVLLAGRIVASITLHKQNGEWQTAAIGQGSGSSRLVEARNELRRTHRADSDAYALVHVTGINERFLVHREQSSILLTSLNKGEALAPRPAAQVFADLAARTR